MKCDLATSDSLELIAAARGAAGRACRDGCAYTRADIMLDEFVDANMRPQTLLKEERDRLMNALDEINPRLEN